MKATTKRTATVIPNPTYLVRNERGETTQFDTYEEAKAFARSWIDPDPNTQQKEWPRIEIEE